MFERLKQKIYAAEAVNRGRQAELDGAKFAAIFCLALIHCTIECIPEEDLASGIPYLFDTVIGGPLSAPLYMFAMGVGMVYAKNRRPADHIRRGLRLCALSYALNVCRFLIPFLAGWLITGEYDKYIAPLPYLVMENDVLLFAGAAMLAIALFQRLGLADGAMLGTALAMSALGSLLVGIDARHPMANILLGYLVGTEDAAGMVHSYFPLLNWLIVPVSGYVFGKRLIHVKNKPLFYGIFSTAGLVVTAAYFSVGITHELGMFGEGQNCYYHITTPDALASICAAVAALGVWYLLDQILPQVVRSIAGLVSRNITRVYCIHWVILSFTVNVALYAARGTQVLPVPAVLLLGTAISVVSIALAHIGSRYGKTRALGAVQ